MTLERRPAPRPWTATPTETGAQAQVKAYDPAVVTPPEGMRFYGGFPARTGTLLSEQRHYNDGEHDTDCSVSAAATFVNITYDGNGGTADRGGTPP
jgi:hypothetical protein